METSPYFFRGALFGILFSLPVWLVVIVILWGVR